MIHDPELTRKLGEFPLTGFAGRVYRATSIGADPTAASTNGGRWSPTSVEEGGIPILYACFDRQGAIAIAIHELGVSTSKTINLTRADLTELGVDSKRYDERNYLITQKIGAAINFLEIDGLVAPSARWNCDNLMIFAENHSLNETLETVSSEEIDWQSWAREAGFL